jgi:hypothetical protein
VVAVEVGELPNDLARRVDAECQGAASLGDGQWIVEGGVDTTAKKETVGAGGGADKIVPDDLARVVDPVRKRVLGRRGIVDRSAWYGLRCDRPSLKGASIEKLEWDQTRSA